MSGLRQARNRGELLRFMTLTDGADLDMAGLYTAWNRLRTYLRKTGELRQYAAVVEAQASGRLHLHVLFTGSYIRQRRLSRLAKQAGFGPVADIRLIRGGRGMERAGRYMAKYLSKQPSVSERSAGVADKAAARVRPVRCSRGWGITLRAAEKRVVDGWVRSRGREPKPPIEDATWLTITSTGAPATYRVMRGRLEVTDDELEALRDEVHQPWLRGTSLRLLTAERRHCTMLARMAAAGEVRAGESSPERREVPSVARARRPKHAWEQETLELPAASLRPRRRPAWSRHDVA